MAPSRYANDLDAHKLFLIRDLGNLPQPSGEGTDATYCRLWHGAIVDSRCQAIHASIQQKGRFGGKRDAGTGGTARLRFRAANRVSQRSAAEARGSRVASTRRSNGL